MREKFKVTVNGNIEFEFDEARIRDLDIQKTGAKTAHVLHKHQSVQTTLEETDFIKKNYKVKVNSTIYEVQISNELDLLIEEMGLSLAVAQVVSDIKAPMPGLILEVLVKVGYEVKAGDYLVVLEAMKMENTLTAPRDGVVKAISVQKGQTVEKNQLLIEME